MGREIEHSGDENLKGGKLGLRLRCIQHAGEKRGSE